MTNQSAPIAPHPHPYAYQVPAPVRRLRTAPPGTPYHRLARTEAHRWWRPLVGTLVAIGGGYAAVIVLSILVDAVGYVTGRPIVDGYPTFGDTADLGVELLMLGLFTPFVLLAARWVQARPAGTVSSVVGRLRVGWLLRCLLIALPTVVVMLAVELTLFVFTTSADDTSGGSEHWPGAASFLAAVGMLLVLLPLQTAAEEYVCRGWLLQAVGAFFRPKWIAIVAQAPVFALAHGIGTPWGFADLIVFAVVLGWLAIRTGGIEAGIALHLANNLVAFTLAAAFGGLGDDSTAADAEWQMFAVSAVMNVAYAAVITWLARHRRIATAVPDAPAPAFAAVGTGSLTVTVFPAALGADGRTVPDHGLPGPPAPDFPGDRIPVYVPLIFPGAPAQPVTSDAQPPASPGGAALPAEDRPAEQHPAEQHPAEQHPAEQHPAEQHPADERPADERPADQP